MLTPRSPKARFSPAGTFLTERSQFRRIHLFDETNPILPRTPSIQTACAQIDEPNPDGPVRRQHANPAEEPITHRLPSASQTRARPRTFGAKRRLAAAASCPQPRSLALGQQPAGAWPPLPGRPAPGPWPPAPRNPAARSNPIQPRRPAPGPRRLAPAPAPAPGPRSWPPLRPPAPGPWPLAPAPPRPPAPALLYWNFPHAN